MYKSAFVFLSSSFVMLIGVYLMSSDIKIQYANPNSHCIVYYNAKKEE